MRASVVMPDHIGTDIAINSSKLLGNDPATMTAAQLETSRERMARAGMDTAAIPDADLRTFMAAGAQAFRDMAPMTAAEASAFILASVQRGEWLSPDGREQTHDEVMAWLREESFRNRYTFEALLSVRDGDLTGEAFCKAMGQGEAVSDWRLMMHNDTNNSHAHVLFFGDKRIEKKAFLAWQAEVRAELTTAGSYLNHRFNDEDE